LAIFSSMNTTAKQMFIAGPANEICPAFSLVRGAVRGYIITAPGAAKTKPRSEDARAIIKPVRHIVYSAKHPNLLATNRCPISCRPKPKETPTIAMRNTMNSLLGSEKARKPPDRAIPKASARISADTTRSRNSFDLIGVSCFSLSGFRTTYN